MTPAELKSIAAADRQILVHELVEAAVAWEADRHERDWLWEERVRTAEIVGADMSDPNECLDTAVKAEIERLRARVEQLEMVLKLASAAFEPERGGLAAVIHNVLEADDE